MFLPVLRKFSRNTEGRGMLALEGVPRSWNKVVNTQVLQIASNAQIANPTRDHGPKPTGQRVRVAESLMRAPTHRTAEQILAAVRRNGERVSKATVYNTLKALVEHGLIRQIHL